MLFLKLLLSGFHLFFNIKTILCVYIEDKQKVDFKSFDNIFEILFFFLLTKLLRYLQVFEIHSGCSGLVFTVSITHANWAIFCANSPIDIFSLSFFWASNKLQCEGTKSCRHNDVLC